MEKGIIGMSKQDKKQANRSRGFVGVGFRRLYIG